MELIEYNKSYKEFKAEMDSDIAELNDNMGRVANGFVRVGYRLKVARDTNVLRDSGYTSVTAFAAAEYKLDKSQVSRFIAINDRFSEGGYSIKLRGRYEEFGYAKLTMMLSLPDELNEILTPDLSKAEVQAIKAEVDEEKKTSDIELYLEQQQEPQQEQEETLLGRALKIFLHDAPDLYGDLHHIIHEDHNAKDLAETFAPAGTKVDFARVPGVGRLAVSFKGADRDIEVVNIRSGEKETADWTALEEILIRLMPYEDVKLSWGQVYGEEYPEKEEVAPVQPNWGKVTMPDMPAIEKPKEKSKVTRAITEKPKPPRKAEPVPEKPLLHDVEPTIPVPDPIPEPEEIKDPVPEEAETQIAGQDSIENHEEWMPAPVEDGEKEEVAPVQPEYEPERRENPKEPSEKKKILDKLYVLRQKVLDENKTDAVSLAGEVMRMIGAWDCEKHYTA